MLSGPSTITVTRKSDGTLHASGFPDHIAVSRELIERADPGYMAVNGDLITFTFANGAARYRIVGETPFGAALCQREFMEMRKC
jgi:hypothetical protein